jgi:hypothetical protein
MPWNWERGTCGHRLTLTRVVWCLNGADITNVDNRARTSRYRWYMMGIQQASASEMIIGSQESSVARMLGHHETGRPGHVIGKSDDLDEICTWSWSLAPRPSIMLALDGFSVSELKVWEEDLNRANRRCGCVAASALLFIACLACGAVDLYRMGDQNTVFWAPIWWQQICLCFGATVIGKILGLYQKRLILTRIVRRLRARAARPRRLPR